MSFDYTKLQQFAELTERKKAIEAEEKAIKAMLDQLEPEIIAGMADVGLDNVKINGRTYYIHRRLFAGPSEGFDKTDVSLALKESGLGEYVTEGYNSNSLAAYVRSVVRESDGADMLETSDMVSLLPEPLRPVLRIGEQFVLASRSS